MIGSLRQGHDLPMVTPAALLGGIGRVDFDELPASFFRFAGQLGKEGRPCRVMNALGQTMVMGHAVDMQVLNADDPIGIDDLTTLLVGEVLPSPRDSLMDSCYRFPMLTPFRRTFCQFGVLALHLSQGFLFFAEKARVLYLSAIREGGKGLESHIDTYLRGIIRQTLRVSLTRERSIPLACRGTVDGEGFDLSLERAVQDHLDMTDARSKELALLVDLKATLGVGEAVIAIFASKSWRARFFTGFAPSKEGFECQVNTHGDILQDLRMDHAKRGAFLFQYRVGGLLLVARQAPALLLIGGFALLKQVVIEPTARFKRLIELRFLLFGGIYSVPKHFPHAFSMSLNASVVNGARTTGPRPK